MEVNDLLHSCAYFLLLIETPPSFEQQEARWAPDQAWTLPETRKIFRLLPGIDHIA
jgi:hypothetical protein